MMKKSKKRQSGRRLTALWLVLCLFSTSLGINVSAVANAPLPPGLIGLTPPVNTLALRGIRFYSENPLKFDFIIEEGKLKAGDAEFKQEASRQIRYFLAALTIPETDLWVNLSPYEQNRIIPLGLDSTDMGEGLLNQDYILKQLSASLTNPQSPLGKQFWEKVYQRAYQILGTTQIPMNTFNKVWIVPDKAVVYADKEKAMVGEARLKVMMEEDYLAQQKCLKFEVPKMPKVKNENINKNQRTEVNNLTSQVMKEIIVPIIEEEVNNGKQFAQLRRIYNAVVLATWMKKKIRTQIDAEAKNQTLIHADKNQRGSASLSALFGVYLDKNKIKGIDKVDPKIKDNVYQKYLEAYKKGAYNYIRREVEPVELVEPVVGLKDSNSPNRLNGPNRPNRLNRRKTIRRRYFSGGCAMGGVSSATVEMPYRPLRMEDGKNVTVRLKNAASPAGEPENARAAGRPPEFVLSEAEGAGTSASPLELLSSAEITELTKRYSMAKAIQFRREKEISQMKYRDEGSESRGKKPQCGYWHCCEYDLVAFVKGEIFEGVTRRYDWEDRREYRRRSIKPRIVFEFSPEIERYIKYNHFDSEHRVWVYTVDTLAPCYLPFLSRVLIPPQADVSVVSGILEEYGISVPVVRQEDAIDSRGYGRKDHYYHYIGGVFGLSSESQKAYNILREIAADKYLLSQTAAEKKSRLLEELAQRVAGEEFAKLSDHQQQTIKETARRILYDTAASPLKGLRDEKRGMRDEDTVGHRTSAALPLPPAQERVINSVAIKVYPAVEVKEDILTDIAAAAGEIRFWWEKIRAVNLNSYICGLFDSALTEKIREKFAGRGDVRALAVSYDGHGLSPSDLIEKMRERLAAGGSIRDLDVSYDRKGSEPSVVDMGSITSNHEVTYWRVDGYHIAIDAAARQHGEKDAVIFIADNLGKLTNMLKLYYGGRDWRKGEPLSLKNMIALIQGQEGMGGFDGSPAGILRDEGRGARDDRRKEKFGASPAKSMGDTGDRATYLEGLERRQRIIQEKNPKSRGLRDYDSMIKNYGLSFSIAEFLSEQTRRWKISWVDAPCGYGTALAEAKIVYGQRLDVYGIDVVNWKMREGVNDNGVVFIRDDIVSARVPKSADIITCLGGLMHVDDPIAVWLNLFHQLAVGGILVLNQTIYSKDSETFRLYRDIIGQLEAAGVDISASWVKSTYIQNDWKNGPASSHDAYEFDIVVLRMKREHGEVIQINADRIGRSGKNAPVFPKHYILADQEHFFNPVNYQRHGGKPLVVVSSGSAVSLSRQPEPQSSSREFPATDNLEMSSGDKMISSPGVSSPAENRMSSASSSLSFSRSEKGTAFFTGNDTLPVKKGGIDFNPSGLVVETKTIGSSPILPLRPYPPSISTLLDFNPATFQGFDFDIVAISDFDPSAAEWVSAK